MRVKSLGMARGLAKFANAPPPGLRRGANECPTVARGRGGWAQVELTDALLDAVFIEKVATHYKKSLCDNV